MKQNVLDQSKAGIYAPDYYTAFRCIADKCRHSCCVDWEIYIDDETYAAYRQKGDIAKTIKESEDGPCFALREDGRCPHLNEDGLCNIILSHGEDYLCEICRNHPRFFNFIREGRIEAGLGIVCEEACRLILENEAPFALSQIGELDGEDTVEFDPLPHRDRVMAMIEASDDFDAAVAALKAAFGLPDPYTPDEWLARFLSLEMLDPAWGRELISMKGRFLRGSGARFGKYYARLLIYFVYRHVSVAESFDELCARLSFAILSAEVIRSLFEANGGENLDILIDLSHRYSAEIEYSEDNTAELIFAFEGAMKGE